MIAAELMARLDPTAGSLQAIFDEVKANPKRIVFAEGEEEKAIRAAYSFQAQGYGTPILVGREDQILATIKELGLPDPEGIEIANARLSDKNQDYIDMLSARAADMRAMVMFFAVIHTGLLVVLGFGGSGLEDSGIQLALTAVTVLTSLWTVFFMDDCMQDLFAISRDLPEDFQASNVGKRFSGVSLPMFRAVNFVVIGLIVLAEVLAIY